VPGIGQAELLGRPATSARTDRTLLVGDDDAVGQRRVQVSPDPGRGERKALGELSDRGRPVLEQRASHPVAGTSVDGGVVRPDLDRRAHGFHNVIIA
jgi:hypothetical protein